MQQNAVAFNWFGRLSFRLIVLISSVVCFFPTAGGGDAGEMTTMTATTMKTVHDHDEDIAKYEQQKMQNLIGRTQSRILKSRILKSRILKLESVESVGIHWFPLESVGICGNPLRNPLEPVGIRWNPTSSKILLLKILQVLFLIKIF